MAYSPVREGARERGRRHSLPARSRALNGANGLRRRPLLPSGGPRPLLLLLASEVASSVQRPAQRRQSASKSPKLRVNY